MPALKVLITGGSGLLGQYLNMELSRDFNILTLYNQNPGNCTGFNSARINLLDKMSLEEIFCKFQPDAVIHTAAVANAEKAASLPESFVVAVNVESTKNIAGLCEKYKSKLIFTSTDLVYDGGKGMMLNEESDINPISLYAESKLKAEEVIKETTGSYLILRTSLLYGIGYCHSICHFHRMYNSFKQGEPVRLFYDQFRTPLSLKNAAEIICELIQKNAAGEIINFGGKERASRYGLGRILCSEGKFDKSLLLGVSMYDNTDMNGVKDVSMDTAKLRSLGIEQKSIAESVRQIISEGTQKNFIP